MTRSMLTTRMKIVFWFMGALMAITVKVLALISLIFHKQYIKQTRFLDYLIKEFLYLISCKIMRTNIYRWRCYEKSRSKWLLNPITQNVQLCLGKIDCQISMRTFVLNEVVLLTALTISSTVGNSNLNI